MISNDMTDFIPGTLVEVLDIGDTVTEATIYDVFVHSDAVMLFVAPDIMFTRPIPSIKLKTLPPEGGCTLRFDRDGYTVFGISAGGKEFAFPIIDADDPPHAVRLAREMGFPIGKYERSIF